jgi:hypothetical protein
MLILFKQKLHRLRPLTSEKQIFRFSSLFNIPLAFFSPCLLALNKINISTCRLLAAAQSD